MINQVMFDFQRLNVIGIDEALRNCLGTVINLEMHGDLVNDLESISDPNNYSVNFYASLPSMMSDFEKLLKIGKEALDQEKK